MSSNTRIGLEKLTSPDNLQVVTDQEVARVQRFQSTLGNCTLVTTVETEIDYDVITPTRVAVNDFLTRKEEGQGVYLEKEFAHYAHEGVPVFTPRISRGGKNSAHGVFFGDLGFESGLSLPVAVKPYDSEDSEKPVLREHFNSRAIREVGLYSLHPMGVILGSSDENYYLTLLEESLTTLDSVDWSKFYPDMDENPGMMQIWSQIARQVALMHSLGSVSHLDLAGRNIAATAGNYAFLIDWERAHVSLVKPTEAEIKYHFSHPDLSSLIETCFKSPNDPFKAGLGIFYKKTGDIWSAIREMFLDEYFATRRALAESEGSEAEIKEVEEELAVLDSSLRLDAQIASEIATLS